MTQIRLVANRIPGTPSWGHFQLVRVGDDGSQTEIEVQAPGLPTVGRDWVFSDPGDPIVFNHFNSTNYDLEGLYAWTTLDLGERDADAVWQILLQAH